MPTYKDQAHLFKLLMHPTRLAILDVLREGEQCVCHMEAMLGLRQAHISQHLMVLRDAELVTGRRDGWNIFYHVSQPQIYQVVDAMASVTGPAGNEQTGVPSPTKKRPCPCPKCNPGVQGIRCDPHNQVLG